MHAWITWILNVYIVSNKLFYRLNANLNYIWTPKVQTQICSVGYARNAPAGWLLLNRRFSLLKLPEFASSLVDLHLWNLLDGLERHAMQEFEDFMVDFWFVAHGFQKMEKEEKWFGLGCSCLLNSCSTPSARVIF